MPCKKLIIKVGGIDGLAELNDTKTAQLIWDNLPIQGTVNTWGEEIYFTIPVTTGIENPQTVVEPSDLGYWPPGRAFCIFFGPTPISTHNEIRPASAVCVVGKLLGKPSEFKKVKNGETIILEKKEDT